MDTEKELWVGALNGMHIVYNPEIQIPGSRWVLLFQVRRNCLISYHKPHARSVLDSLNDPDKRVEILKAYEAWRRTATQSMPDDAADDVRRKDEHLKERLASARAMHRRRLERASVAYCGVTEPGGRGVIRSTVCRGCHRDIGTDAHLLCNGCGWTLCLSCGVCGCGG